MRNKEVKEFFKRNKNNSLTFFFREPESLDFFRENIVKKRNQKTKVASAGCSSGKEPYTIILSNWENRNSLEIDAYDINENKIKQGISGEYEIFNLNLIERYNEFGNFKNIPSHLYEVSDGRHESYKNIKLSKEVKEKINFKVHDILYSPLPEKYDAIFLQYVLMDYSENDREKILSNINESMKEKSFLICESVFWGKDHEFAEYSEWMKDIERLGFEKHKTAKYKRPIQIYAKK